MKINGRQIIDDFISEYPLSRKPFLRWFELTLVSQWKNFVDVHKTFITADYVAPYTVFDIGGNKWRLITIIEYSLQLIIIRQAMIHSEYDKGKWK